MDIKEKDFILKNCAFISILCGTGNLISKFLFMQYMLISNSRQEQLGVFMAFVDFVFGLLSLVVWIRALVKCRVFTNTQEKYILKICGGTLFFNYFIYFVLDKTYRISTNEILKHTDKFYTEVSSKMSKDIVKEIMLIKVFMFIFLLLAISIYKRKKVICFLGIILAGIYAVLAVLPEEIFRISYDSEHTYVSPLYSLCYIIIISFGYIGIGIYFLIEKGEKEK